MYSPMTSEEFELWATIRRLGGGKKVKELLDSLEKHNVKIDDLLNYLKSIDYKIPNALETRIAELEKRVSKLEERIGKPRPPKEDIAEKYKGVIEVYKENGLETEILEILKIFEEKRENSIVQIKAAHPEAAVTPVVLEIGNRKIQVVINSNPNSDHGVWVFDSSLYDKVYELGQSLGLKVKKGTSTKFLKIIRFNGVEGIKSVSGKMQDLVDGLIKIVKGV
jgi:hypothetical protein